MSRLADPQFSFADLELRHQGVHLDPSLQAILGFLDDHAALVEQVRQDLVRGLKNPNTGRTGITPGRTMARTGLRMMPTSPWSPLKFRKAGFPCYGFKAGMSDGPSRRARVLRVVRFASVLRAPRCL